jgi:hypothetical protein
VFPLPLMALECRDFSSDHHARGMPTESAGESGESGSGGERDGPDAGGQSGEGGRPADGGNKPGAGRGGSDGSGASGPSGSAGLKGEGGKGGKGGEANGGSGSGDSGEDGGEAGTTGGEGGSSGAAGDTQGPPAPSEPASYGAVRLFTDGQAVCGGTLITNDWVLTASRCIPAATPAAKVEVRFGADSRYPQQVRTGAELHRFPVHLGERDLALVGVDAPFEIAGSTTRHFIPILPVHAFLLQTHVCAGWDMTPDSTSPTNLLKTVWLSPSSIVEANDANDGTRVWWRNTNPVDKSQGTLLTTTDTGVGCFYRWASSIYLSAVHTGNPVLTPDLEQNQDDYAYSLSPTDPAVMDWLDQLLFRVMPTAELELRGVATACSPTPDSIDLFGSAPDGRMAWYRRAAPEGSWEVDVEWEPLPPIDPPSAGLAADRPGAVCLSDGSVDLVARAPDGSAWRQRFEDGSWETTWEQVAPPGAATSGLSAVGQIPGDFQVYGQGPGQELRRLTVRKRIAGAWEDLTGGFRGSPAARMANPDWVDVFVRTSSGNILANAAWSSEPRWLQIGDFTISDPAVASWKPDRIDLFLRTSTGMLARKWYEMLWVPSAIATGLIPPLDSELTAVARHQGSVDVLASGGSLELWHATWPRRPQP